MENTEFVAAKRLTIFTALDYFRNSRGGVKNTMVRYID